MRSNLYTAFVKCEDCIEEIDQIAMTRAKAKELIQKTIDEEYDPGCKIVKIVQRQRGWMFHEW